MNNNFIDRIKSSAELASTENNVGRRSIFYPDNCSPKDAIIVTLPDGKTAVVSIIMTGNGENRVIVQHLNGTIIHELQKLYRQHACIDKDNGGIYVVTSQTLVPTLHKFSLSDFKEQWYKELPSGSQVTSVKVTNNEITLCDMGREIYIYMDKNGNEVSRDSLMTNHGHGMQSKSSKIMCKTQNSISIMNYSEMPKETLMQLSAEIGEEVMKRNSYIANVAIDGKQNRYYCSADDLIFVMEDEKYKGLIYLPNKFVRGLNFDHETGILIVSTANYKETGPVADRLNKGGSIELLPREDIDILMESSIQALKYKKSIEEGIVIPNRETQYLGDEK